MLRQRLITGFFLLLLGLILVALPAAILLWILLSVAVVCAWEWARLAGSTAVGKRLGYAAVAAVAVGVITSYPESMPWLMGFISIFWCLSAPGWLFRYSSQHRLWSGPRTLHLLGLAIIVAAVSAAHWLRTLPHGSYLLAGVLVSCIAADIGAYGAGKLWGRTALIPRVSPAKTWQGLIGGIALAVLAALLAGYLTPPGWRLGLPMLVAIPFAVIGDLFESMVKRHAQIKDSGSWLPGHGGVLDRLDSLLAALPPFSLLVWYLA